jgi:hypothetical protein
MAALYGDVTDSPFEMPMEYRGIQTKISIQWHALFTVRMADELTDGIILSVSPSAKVNICPLCRPSPPLFLLLPHPNSPLLQTTSPKKKNLPLLSTTSHISQIVEVLWSQHPCSDLPMDFIRFCK